MLVSKVVKAAVLLPPKTGTRTLVGMCTRPQIIDYVSCMRDMHVKYAQRHQILKDADEYQLYAFYRCPVDRVVSNYRYSVREWSRLGSLPIAKEVVDEVVRQVNAITLSEYLGLIEDQVKYPTLDLAIPQIHWVGPEVELLNFHSFDAELTRLQRLLGCPIPTSMPVSNDTDSKQYTNTVTSDDVARIKRIYAEDYDFFGSRGITFDR